MELFDFRRITKEDKLYEEIFRLRFQVYCREWGFEKEEDHENEMEIDHYDEADQCIYVGAIHKESGKLVGTARVIMLPANPQPFPMEKQFFVRSQVGEISRLAVTKELSRRVDDLHAIMKNPHLEELPPLNREVTDRRNIANDIVFGLYRALCAESGKEGLSFWYAAMARSLFALLKRRGVNFIPLGPERDYHGMRRAYLGYIPDILKENELLSQAYMQQSI